MRLIDADKLADNMKVLVERNKSLIDEWLAVRILDEIIETPTVEAEPIRHGKWLMNDVYGAYCSECGSAAFEITGSQYSRMKTRYCWQCGARMDENEIDL